MFTTNYYLLFQLNYNWRHCSALSLTVVMCVSVPKECAFVIRSPSAKQCNWLFHARPAPFPFPIFLFPEIKRKTFTQNKNGTVEISQFWCWNFFSNRSFTDVARMINEFASKVKRNPVEPLPYKLQNSQVSILWFIHLQK